MPAPTPPARCGSACGACRAPPPTSPRAGGRRGDAGTWTPPSGHLWKVTAAREGEDDAGSTLEIRLPDEIARSIREGDVKPLDLGVYRELSSPPVRAVYRVLDALRWDSGSAQDRVTVNLLELGECLSIYSTEPDEIRWVLQPPHEELQSRGILRAVEMRSRS